MKDTTGSRTRASAEDIQVGDLVVTNVMGKFLVGRVRTPGIPFPYQDPLLIEESRDEALETALKVAGDGHRVFLYLSDSRPYLVVKSGE